MMPLICLAPAQVVQDFRDAGWLTPIVERKRVTLFDVVDLARCRKLLKKHGDLKLQELAKNGRAVVQRLVCKSESALLSVEKSFFWDFIRIEA